MAGRGRGRGTTLPAWMTGDAAPEGSFASEPPEASIAPPPQSFNRFGGNLPPPPGSSSGLGLPPPISGGPPPPFFGGGGGGGPSQGPVQGQPYRVKLCHNFAAGNCNWGDKCNFKHEMPGPGQESGGSGFGGGDRRPAGKGVCFQFLKGSCTWGDKCNFRHEAPKEGESTGFPTGGFGGGDSGGPPVGAADGAPQKTGVCHSFLRGECRYGDRCAYNHIDTGGTGKIGICHAFQRGECNRGDRCVYNHFAAGVAPPPTSFGRGAGFGQAAPHMPQASEMSAGPFHPVIFGGHMGEDFANASLAIDGDNGASVNVQQDGGIRVYEIYFGKKVFFLEGIEIIHKGKDAPGVDIPFFGMTEPSDRPIRLEMFARDIDNRTMATVLGVTVTSATSWVEIKKPYNTLGVDYIAFRGDFTNLSLLIHGGDIDPEMLSHEAHDFVEQGIPVPMGWVDPVQAAMEVDYSSDEDNFEERGGDRMRRLPVPTKAVLRALTFPVNTLQSRLNAKIEESVDSATKLLTHLFDNETKSFAGDCLVDADSIAPAISEVMDMTEEKWDETSFGDGINFLDKFGSAFLKCLETSCSKRVDTLVVKDKKDATEYKPLREIFGEDACRNIATIVVKALKVLDVEEGAELRASARGSGGPFDIIETSSSILKACDALLANEITAKAFGEAEGMHVLVVLCTQDPELPRSIALHVQKLIRDGLNFFPNIVSFIEAPIFDQSDFQLLVSTIKTDLDKHDAIAKMCVESINICQLVHSVQQLKEFFKSNMDEMYKLAQQITVYASTISSGGTDAVIESNVSLEEAGDALKRLFLECKEKVMSMEAAMTTCASACTDDRDNTWLLIKLLDDVKVSVCLPPLVALAEIASELSTFRSGDTQDTETLKENYSFRYFTCLLTNLCTGFVESILEVGSSEVVFAMASEEMALVHSYVASNTSILSAQPIEEIDSVSKIACSRPQYGMTLSSLGCSLKLMVFIGLHIEKLLDALYDKSFVFIAAGDNKDDGASLWTVPLSSLFEYCCFPAGAALVARMTSGILLPALIQKLKEIVAMVGSLPLKEFKNVELVVRMLLICIQSENTATIRNLTSHYGDIFAIAQTLFNAEATVEMKKLRLYCKQILKLNAFDIKQANGETQEKGGARKRTKKEGVQVSAVVENLGSKQRDALHEAAIELLFSSKCTDANSLMVLEHAVRTVASMSILSLYKLVTKKAEGNVLTKMLNSTLNLLDTTNAWIRGGSGWAHDPSTSINGYEESLFRGLVKHMPAATDDTGKPEKVDMESIQRNSILLLRALHSSLKLINLIFTVANRCRVKATSNGTFFCESIINSVLESNSIARNLIGCNKSGSSGFLARRINQYTLHILLNYCPPSHWFDKETCRVIPYLIAQGLEHPRLLEANMALVSDLVSISVSSSVSYMNAGESDGVDDKVSNYRHISHNIESMILNEAFVQQSVFTESLSDAVAATDYDLFASDVHMEKVLSEWEDLLCNQPVLVGTLKCDAFSLRYSEGPAFAEDYKPTSVTVIEAEASREHRDQLLSDTIEALQSTKVANFYGNTRPLATSFLSRSYTISDAVLHMLYANSIDSYETVYRLCRACIPVSTTCAKQVIKPFLRITEELLATFGETLETDAADEADFEDNANQLSRVLTLLSSLCGQNPGFCLLCVGEGVLYHAFACMQSAQQYEATVALQLVTTIYKGLSTLKEGSDGISADVYVEPDDEGADGIKEEDDEEDAANRSIKLMLIRIADGLVATVPEVLNEFKDADESIFLAQSAITMHALSRKHLKLFIDTLNSTGSGVSVEVYVIKLWIYLEDAFQALAEVTEVFKSFFNVDNKGNMVKDVDQNYYHMDDGKDELNSSFAAVAVAASALRCACDMIVLAFKRGWISISVFKRSMRTTAVDPRKASLLFQRTYTMWWTGERLRLMRAQLCHDFNNITKDGDELLGGDSGVSIEPPIELEKTDTLLEDGQYDMEARNAMINASLRRIVETARLVMDYDKSLREQSMEKPTNADHYLPVTRGPDMVYLQTPFDSPGGECLRKILKNQYENKGSGVRDSLWTVERAVEADDAFHRVIRRTILFGGEKRGSVFTNPHRFIRLKKLPASTGSNRIQLRKERRGKRMAEMLVKDKENRAARLQQAEAMKEAAAMKRKLEEESEQSQSKGQVALSGVPTRLLQRNNIQGDLVRQQMYMNDPNNE